MYRKVKRRKLDNLFELYKTVYDELKIHSDYKFELQDKSPGQVFQEMGKNNFFKEILEHGIQKKPLGVNSI